MILVPYFWDTSKVNPNWLKLAVFLCNGGREYWTLEGGETDRAIKKMLLDNGFPLSKLTRAGDTVYALIDHTKLKMGNFYQWKDKISDNDMWRTFTID